MLVGVKKYLLIPLAWNISMTWNIWHSFTLFGSFRYLPFKVAEKTFFVKIEVCDKMSAFQIYVKIQRKISLSFRTDFIFALISWHFSGLSRYFTWFLSFIYFSLYYNSNATATLGSYQSCLAWLQQIPRLSSKTILDIQE